MKLVPESVWPRFAVLILFILTAPMLAATALSDDLMTARVVGVADGDNITVLTPLNKQIMIRLYGIDCPAEEQAFGVQAKQFTSGQCFGMTIQYRLMGIDRFDRTIAIVFLEDGRELNLEILKAGFAWHYERYAKRQEYVDAEAEARKAGVGLWADPNPTPPWNWRQEKRKKS
jgi:micrococcal nuclease